MNNEWEQAENIYNHEKQNGKKLSTFPNDYIVIDIETTGLSPEYDEIIEISAIKYVNNQKVDAYSSLVYVNRNLDNFITELTGITNAMLSTAPNINDVIQDFSLFISNNILVGHNVNFDIKFLQNAYKKYLFKSLTNDFVDTLSIARRLHKEEKHNRLKDLAKRYNLNYEGAHRSLFDCELTNQVLQIFKNECLDKYGADADLDIILKSTKKNNNHNYLKAKNIVANTDYSIDEDNPIYGKVFVFTGTLEHMIRKDAMQIVANLGGINSDNVTKSTNYLILGNNDYCSSIKDGKSSKHKKAEKLKSEGCDIEILPENVFYDMLEN